MRRYLVVANQTACGPELQEAVTRLAAESECGFLLVVPATHPRDQLMWTDGTAYGLARRRLQDALGKLRGVGADIEGWVGDENPHRAVGDALEDHEIDEVILSTFAPGISRWLRMDVASRIRSDFEVPVRVIESERLPVTIRR